MKGDDSAIYGTLSQRMQRNFIFLWHVKPKNEKERRSSRTILSRDLKLIKDLETILGGEAR